MVDTKELIHQRYTGDRGKEYHTAIHSNDPYVQQVVARQRLHKFQPFVKSDDTVLEFGVGMGWNLRYLNCQRRVGYDVSDIGYEICKDAGIEFTTDLASLSRGQFSLVICHHVLEHVPDPVGVLEQIWGLLAPEGRLILCVPFESHYRFRHFSPGDPNRHLFSWNILTLGNLVTSVNFSVDSAKIIPSGYEQRLAFLARYGFPLYHLGLAMLRRLMPVEEIFLVALKNESPKR
jgi:SAM-dependent methyltransferase